MIFAWHKIGKSNTAGSIPNEKNPPIPEPTPTTVSNETSSNEGGPDWLKPTESPFGSEDVLSKEVSQNQNEVHTPEWMGSQTPAQPETKDNTPHDVPDWLKDSHESTSTTTPSWLTEEAETPAVVEPQPEKIIPPENPKIVEDESHEDIPHWLKDTETEPVSTLAATTPAPSTNPFGIEENPVKEETTIPEVQSAEVPLTEKKEENQAEIHHDIPDWLKGAETASETVEEKTPEISV